MKRRDIVEYRTARQMGTIAKQLGVSFRILHRSGEDGIPRAKVEVEILFKSLAEMDGFDRAMSGTTEADVLKPWYLPHEVHVANLELCKQLFELSEWRDQYFEWLVNRKESIYTIVRDWGRDGASVVYDPNNAYYPAYDLSYLLRKFVGKGGITIRYGDRGCVASAHVWTAEAATPEDCVAKLIIELFQQGVLKRE